jgi:hypothetical protein
MQGTISIKKDNGERIEIVKDVKNVEDTNIIDSIEQQMLSIRQEVFPLLSAQLIEQHQQGFKGEKNKKKEWE